MRSRVLFVIVFMCLSACASNDKPMPETLDWPSGCFEIPIGENPDGSLPMACTLSTQNKDKHNTQEQDDKENNE